jgi:hypothetical protein
MTSCLFDDFDMASVAPPAEGFGRKPLETVERVDRRLYGLYSYTHATAG